MMLHPEMTRQLAAARQQDLLNHASRHRQARAAQAARSARHATVTPTRPSLLGRIHAALTSRQEPPLQALASRNSAPSPATAPDRPVQPELRLSSSGLG